MLNQSIPRSLLLGIFLTFFSVSFFATSRERPWNDATPIWMVAESIVDRGEVDTPVRWPYEAPTGRNGKLYAFNPILTSVVHVPGAALHAGIKKYWPKAAGRYWPLACHLAPAALGALVCMLFFILCMEHGLGVRVSTASTLILGLASTVWVYARYPHSEILQAACFIGAFLQLIRLDRNPSVRGALYMGLWAAALINSKTVYLTSFPLVLVYLAWTHRRDRGILGRIFLGSLLGVLPGIALMLFYNWLRFGSITSDGYNLTTSDPVVTRGNVWVGLWGIMLSPGKSIFLYSPPLLLGFFGFRKLIQHSPRSVIFMVLTILPPLWVHARLAVWHGDWAWGPRYAVFAVPVLSLSFAFYLQLIGQLVAKGARWIAIGVLLIIFAFGLVVQVAGSAFHWDHFIRISQVARKQWMGNPNRQGALGGLAKGENCDPCMEQLYQLHWLPHFQPIRGHLWLLQHVPFGHDWTEAEVDAPWHPETSLSLNIADMYPRARVDWWALEFQRHKGAAFGIGGGMLLGIMLGIGLWTRGHRRCQAIVLGANPHYR